MDLHLVAQKLAILDQYTREHSDQIFSQFQEEVNSLGKIPRQVAQVILFGMQDIHKKEGISGLYNLVANNDQARNIVDHFIYFVNRNYEESKKPKLYLVK